MELQLSDEEGEALRHVLAALLVELKGEIHDTDNVTFRKGLTQHREMLQSIQFRLGE